MAEAFFDDRDLEVFRATPQRLRIRMHLRGLDSRIVAVVTRDHFQQQRIVGDAVGHGAGVVDEDLDRHDAGVRHESPRRLHPVHAAVRRGHPDRAALVAADRHVDLARRHQCGAARGRPARRETHLARIVYRSGGVGMASAGEAETLAMRLADDLAARVQDARDDGGVEVGYVALQGRRTIHHRHAREHHVVLEHDGLALKLALARALDRRLVVPGVVLVLLVAGPVAGRARIFDPRHFIGHRGDGVVSVHVGRKQDAKRIHAGIIQRQSTLSRHRAQLLPVRHLNGHAISSL